jgi:hypothetical protein
MKQIIFEITDTRQLTETVFEMKLRGDVSGIKCGQFVNLLIDGLYLRRPISVCDLNGDVLTLVYKVVGKGTEKMSLMKEGEKLDLTDVDVNVEVGLKDIEISDNQEIGGALGNIVSIIYKGDHYQLIVRTPENEEDYVFDTEDTWNENDSVSVIIKPENIKLSLKEEIKR